LRQWQPGVILLHSEFRVRHAGKAGLILLDQIRTVDKVRLIKRSGTLNTTALKATLSTVAEIFAD